MFHIKRVYINYLFTTMQKEFITGLKLRNSLSNQLVSISFNPSKHSYPWMDNVKWYTCGPTVYSNSHMGHARYNYQLNLETICVMIWFVEYYVIILDTTFSIVWISLMLMTKLLIDQINKEFNIFNLLEDGKMISSMIWRKNFIYFRQLGVETPDYITRVTEYIP